MRKKHHQISAFALNDSQIFFWIDSFLVAVSALILIINFTSPYLAAIDVPVLIAVSVAGLLPVIFNAIKSLIQKHLTIDLLASVALIFSLLAGEWHSAVFISLMLASARLFTRYTAGRAKRSIGGLLKLRPVMVHLVGADGKPKETHIDEIKVGDIVMVESGERIAVDGIVQSGEASIDQSSLTGESNPVGKKTGDEVLSSTLNVGGSLIVRATKVGADTAFAKILELVEKSQDSKAQIVSVTEKFTGWYILATFILAGVSYYLTRNIGLSLAILLVTCADDLAVAIPLAFSAAIATLAKRGIIVKGGNFIEGLSETKIMIFDKTGTITEGQPQVVEVATFHGYSKEKFLALLGAAEQDSAHPAARAAQKYVAEKNITVPPITLVHEEPGFGIKGRVDGQEVVAGKVKFLKDNGIDFSPDELDAIEEQKKKRRMLTSLGIGKELLGFISFSDAVRPVAPLAIAQIKEFGVKRTVMLTGDNEKIAGEVAKMVGIDELQANLLPQDKVNFIKGVLSPKYKVAMVGDGVNDAAGLALADIGIAMGSIGSDAAIGSADIILAKDNLRGLAEVMNLGRFTMKIISQDLWVWGTVNVMGLALVFMGYLDPGAAAAYNFITDFLPLLNSLRVFRFRFAKDASDSVV
ncbi:MAG: cation-translocating P-type ATPase [Candidatus Portnoybacteria bacterium]|nr:cation-translocating P-type ATPase [Candidatus Portnoybacteria bacterium]MDD4982361.1 cation-translocating P-type ATPase [Candidatus Portnoybacteria bacterium]